MYIIIFMGENVLDTFYKRFSIKFYSLNEKFSYKRSKLKNVFNKTEYFYTFWYADIWNNLDTSMDVYFKFPIVISL